MVGKSVVGVLAFGGVNADNAGMRGSADGQGSIFDVGVMRCV